MPPVLVMVALCGRGELDPALAVGSLGAGEGTTNGQNRRSDSDICGSPPSR
jgi:hypothetical protein